METPVTVRRNCLWCFCEYKPAPDTFSLMLHKFNTMQADIKALAYFVDNNEVFNKAMMTRLLYTITNIKKSECPWEEKRILRLLLQLRESDHSGYCTCDACLDWLDILYKMAKLIRYVHKKYVKVAVQKQLVVLLMLERIPVDLVRVVGEFLV